MPIETEDIHYRESRNRNADVSDRLYVPETRDVRDRLRARVAAFVSERELTPPLSLAELEDHSEEIIERNGLDPRVEDFLKILINNEAWPLGRLFRLSAGRFCFPRVCARLRCAELSLMSWGCSVSNVATVCSANWLAKPRLLAMPC